MISFNAKQVSGVDPERELPVVWAVAKGSFKNKWILVPLALALSFWLPWSIMPLLMMGGLFLCFEGVEKLVHPWLHSKAELEQEHAELVQELADHPGEDLVALEKDKIRGAIRTDFVLSAEIIVIALGTIGEASFATRAMALASVAILMTIGVYGFVGLIVKIDDLGQHLSTRKGRAIVAVGNLLLWIAPRLMRGLAIGGTIAMFLVGGGILTHGTPFLHHFIQHAQQQAMALPWAGRYLGAVAGMTLNGLAGAIAGLATLVVVLAAKRVRGRRTA